MGNLIAKTPRKVGRPKKKLGRPLLVSEQTLEKLLHAYSIGCTDEQACLYADISVATLYNWQKKNPKFLERKATLKENPVLKARLTVVNDLKNNVETAKWYLERRAKGEFSQKVEQETNINVVFNNGIPRPKEIGHATSSVPGIIEGETV